MKRIFLLFLASCSLQSADVLTVDPAGTVIIVGTAPATPAAGEVRLGSGQVKAQGTVTAGDVVINRAAQASGAQAVRGDDPRINAGGTKAWVNFDGITMTVRGSFNVTSVNRLATGQYQVNFTQPFASAAYAPIISCGPEAMTAYFNQVGALTTTSVSFVCINGPLTATNASIITVAVMGF